MTTCSDIVRRGFRHLNVIKAGGEATGQKATDGMEALQGAILDLPGLVKNARWTEEATSTAYEADEGDRITVTGTPAITFPATVYDCDLGLTRPPLDLARVYVIGGLAATAGLWIYSATKGEWGLATGLALADDHPFGEEDDAGLAAYLAVTIMDDYGADVSDRIAIRANQFVRSARARFKKAEPSDDTRPDTGLWSGDYV